jgi:hypothetical protein
MKIGLILHYTEVFPGGNLPSLEEEIKKIPQKIGLEVLCSINARLHTNQFKESIQKEILFSLLEGQEQVFKFQIISAIYRQSSISSDFHMFDTYCCLKVINSLIQNPGNIVKDNRKLTVEEEKAIIIAILIANEELNENVKKQVPKKASQLDDFCTLAWPNVLMTATHRQRNNFILSLYKSVTFLEYISTNKKIEKHFVEYFKMDSSASLMKFAHDLLNFYVNGGMNKSTKLFNYRFVDEIDKNNPILAKYCLDLATLDIQSFKSKDFNTLRKHPIIKLDSKNFIISNWNFILEKLHVGLVFDLFYNTDIKEEYSFVDKKTGIKKYAFDTFKGKIGYDYSEKLFQQYFIDTIVGVKDIYKLGEPDSKGNQDFYLRQNKKIALIEFKDLLMVKHFTYEEVKDEIDSKLNGTKGVGQLKKLIDKINENINVFEAELSNTINTSGVILYPVIVVSESLFAAPGVTQYLNKVLQTSLSEKKYSFYIKPLVIIPFDFLLEIKTLFDRNQYDFFSILETHFTKSFLYRKKAMRTDNLNSRIRQYNGLAENLSYLIPDNFAKKRILAKGTLAEKVARYLQLKHS